MSLFQTFLTHLAPVLEFQDLKPDQHGACLIIMKEHNVPLLFEFDESLVPNSILLSSPVAQIEVGCEEQVHGLCLKGNEQMHNTLSKRPDEDQIYLHRRLHPDIDTEQLRPIIQQFVEHVVTWKQKLEAVGGGH